MRATARKIHDPSDHSTVLIQERRVRGNLRRLSRELAQLGRVNLRSVWDDTRALVLGQEDGEWTWQWALEEEGPTAMSFKFTANKKANLLALMLGHVDNVESAARTIPAHLTEWVTVDRASFHNLDDSCSCGCRASLPEAA